MVIAGDTNNSDRQPLYGIGREAGRLNDFAATHLTNKCYDRLVAAGAGKWAGIEILKPPYGKKPDEANKRGWTDHFFVGAVRSSEAAPSMQRNCPYLSLFQPVKSNARYTRTTAFWALNVDPETPNLCDCRKGSRPHRPAF